MTTSRRLAAQRLYLAAVAGLTAYAAAARPAHAQQNPADPTVFLNASDTPTTSSFYNGSNFQASSSGTLPAGTAPAVGYAYVVTGSANAANGATAGTLRTPQNGSTGIPAFAGDSLTILPFNGQANLYNPSATAVPNPMDTTASLNLIYSNTSEPDALHPERRSWATAARSSTTGGKSTTLLNGADRRCSPAGTTVDGITTNDQRRHHRPAGQRLALGRRPDRRRDPGRVRAAPLGVDQRVGPVVSLVVADREQRQRSPAASCSTTRSAPVGHGRVVQRTPYLYDQHARPRWARARSPSSRSARRRHPGRGRADDRQHDRLARDC